MTYEEHLDEVTTLITEKYGLDDEPAIQMVMRAQADGFFSGHDDDPAPVPGPDPARTLRGPGPYRDPVWVFWSLHKARAKNRKVPTNGP